MRQTKKARLKKIFIFEGFFLFFILSFSPAFAAAPKVGTITPSSGSTVPGTAKTFTCKYSDADGWADIKEAYLLINANYIDPANSVYLYYDRNNNLLYLRDDANVSWLGGYAPGSGNVVENSQVTLNCGSSSVSRAKSTLTVNFNITFKTAYSGKKYNSYLKVVDASGGYAGWALKGSYSINSIPQAGTIIPQSGISSPNQQINFETTYSDPDGWENIQYVYFLVNTSTGGAKCFYGYYDQNTNKIYLRNDANKGWLGGYAPGSNNIIENSYAKIDCSTTAFSGSGNDLTVNWSVTFKTSFTGTKNTYIYVKDDLNAYVNWTKIGNWSIVADITPPTGAITINDNAGYTNSASVTLNLSAQDNAGGSGLDKMQFSNDNVVWTSAEPYAVSKTWELGAGDGTKTVYVKYSDLAGNWSVTYSDTIILDALAPAVPVVNPEMSPTNIPTQTLSGTKEAETSIWINGQEVVPLDTQTTWSSAVNLTEGSNNISVTAKDAVGNESSAVLVTIVLDTTLPTGAITINDNAGYTTSLSVTLNLSAQDNAGGSGLDKMQFSNDNVTWTLAESYANSKTWTLSAGDGTKTVYVKYSDMAGNWSVAYSDTIILDAVAPAVPVVNAVTSPTNIYTQTISGTKEANTSIWINGQEAVSLNTQTTWSSVVNLAEGTNNISITAKNAVGNESSAALVAIVLDITPPNQPRGITIAVNGTNADLSWTANSETDLAGYNIYRSTISGSNYEKRNSSLINLLTFQDSGLINGTTYYYVIKAKDNAGNESIYSSEVSTTLSDFSVETEPNNDFSSANTLQLDTAVKGSIDSAADRDYFKVSIQKTGKIRIFLTDVPANIAALVYIYDANQGIVAANDGAVPGSNVFLEAGPFSAGDYYVAIFDANGNESSLSQYILKISFTELWFYSYYNYPPFFSPNADSVQDSTLISANVSVLVNWTINIKDSSGVIKQTLTGSSQNISQDWNGLDSSGVVVTDGVYTYTIDAINPNTGSIATQAQGQITVDNTLPTASITEPVSGAVISGTVAIKGIADDLNYYSANTYYGQGTAPESWTYITSGVLQRGANPSLLANFDTTVIPNGDYVLRLEVFDSAGNIERYDLPVKLYNVAIYNVFCSPTFISPNSDGVQDLILIKANITAPVNWAINIKDSSGVVKRTFTGTGTNISQDWNGLDSSGAVVTDGVYIYTIDAIDPNTGLTAIQAQGQVTVDNTLPTASITEPASGAAISGTVTIRGIANDTNYSYSNLYYGQGIVPASWTYIVSGISQTGSIPSVLTSFDTSILPNGDYVLRLEVFDSAGNIVRYDLPVKLYNVAIYNVSCSSAFISPNADSVQDSTLIRADITSSVNWTINIKDSSGAVKRTFTGTGANIFQVWDGSDSSGTVVTDGVYSYTIDAVDPNTGSTALQVQGQVTVDNTLPAAGITEPVSGATVSGTVEIKGIADDSYYQDANLCYGQGITPERWTYIAYQIGQTGITPAVLANFDTTTQPNGDYVLRLEVSDYAGNIGRYDLPVKIYNVAIYNVFCSPTFISPNADSVQDSTVIRADITSSVNWTINIKDPSSVVKQTFMDTGANISQVWNGLDSSGAVVTDGVYTYTIDAVDPNTGSTVQAQGQVTVDNTLPTVSITEPVSGASISGTVTIRGIANDTNYSYSNLYYGQGAAPVSWNRILSGSFQTGLIPTTLINFDTSNLTSGNYVLRLEVFDSAGNIGRYDLPVKIYNVTIYNVSCSPAFISPNADSLQDSTVIRADITASVNWTINIKDPSGVVKQTFMGTGANISQVWNGLDSSGAVVTDGVYTYTIDAVDPNTGSTVQAQGQIIVDNTLPTASITGPVSGTTVSGTVTIKGIADDNNYYYASLYYGQGANPVNWNYIASIVQTGLTPAALTNFNTTNLPSGDYVLRLEIFDLAGNIGRYDLPVKIYNVAIYNVSSSPTFISPNNDGAQDSTVISANVTALANWTINIRDSSWAVKRTFTGTGENISQVWNGLDSFGAVVNDGVYSYTIDAVDQATGLAATQAQGQVSVDNTLPTASITGPVSGATVSGTVTIKGIADDNNYYYASLYYGQGANPVNWNYIVSIGQTGLTPAALTNFDTTNFPSGDYVLRLEIFDYAGNIGRYDLPVKLYNVAIYDVVCAPAIISPNSDGVKDSVVISANVTTLVNWTINIKDSSGVVKQTFTGTGADISQVWNGLDSFGSVVTDGVYSCIIDAVDPDTGSTATQAQGQIIVDNTLPTVSITEPLSGAVISGIVTIKGITNDNNYYFSSLCYGQGTAPVNWVCIARSIAHTDSTPAILADIDTTNLPNGDYVLRLETSDSAGNIGRYDLPVKFNNISIYSVVVSPNKISPNGDGNFDSAGFSASMTRNLNWAIEISDVNNAVVKTYTGTGNTINQSWFGQDSNAQTVVDGVYKYAIKAWDIATGINAVPFNGEVVVDNTRPTAIISQPINNQEINGLFDIKGIVNDLNYNANYKCFLALGRGVNPTAWQILSWLFKPVIEGNNSPALIYRWNTGSLPNGPYTLHLFAADAAGNTSEVKNTVNLYNVGVLNHSVNPACFSPNNDGKSDIAAISASLTMPAHWTIKISDKNNNQVRAFTGVSDIIAQEWDGKDSSSNIAPDGIYAYTIDTLDPDTNISGIPVSGFITVDNTVPVAFISSPEANAIVTNTVEIKGIAKDLNYDGSKNQSFLAYAKESSPENWSVLRYLYYPVLEDYNNNPGVIHSLDFTAFPSGKYILKLLVTDAAQNSTEFLLPFIACKVNNYYAEPLLFSPNSDGRFDTTAFIAAFSRPVDWTINVKNSSGASVRNFSGAGFNIYQIWDGKNSSNATVADGAYTFDISATAQGSGESVLTGSGNVEIDNTAPVVNIVQPAANSSINGIIPVSVISDDPHYDSSKSVLYYGQGALPVEWKIISGTVLSSPVEYTAANWDTRPFKNGAYTLRLAVYDLAGNYAQAETPVDVYNVGILNFSDAPDPFTPDNDGVKDTNTITAALTAVLDWNIAITDSANTLIRNFNGSGETISCVWDGKNNSGQVAGEGIFNYRIEATDKTTNAAPVSGTITTDTSLPVATITAPSDNSVVSGFVTITGTASDNNISEYKVEYGFGATPENWDLIDTGSVSINDGKIADWDCAKVINGIYTLKLTVTDIAGHTASAQVKVTVEHINITNIWVTPELINPLNGETSLINYTIERAADITIKIYDLDNNLKRNLITAAPRAASYNSEVWDGRDDAGNIVGDNAYTITIEAQSEAARGWYQSKDRPGPGRIAVLDFSVSPTFNPYGNEMCKITYTLPQSALFLLQVGQNGNFDTLNTLVNWEARSAGPHTEYWDGRDGKGVLLDYYTVQIPIIIGCQTQLLPENSIVVACGQPGSSEILKDVSSNPYVFLPVLGEFTYIKYTISLPGVVSVSICNSAGEVIKNLENNVSKTAGTYNLRWDGSNQTGKIVGGKYNYTIKVDFTGADGKIISRVINATTR